MEQEKAIKIYKILAFLVLLLMVTATILGGIFVNNIQAKDADPQTISMYRLKKEYAFPEWTSLPLILNIVFGFIATHTGNREILNIKMGFDILQIVFRVLLIGFLAGIVIPPYLNCLTTKESHFLHHLDGFSVIDNGNSTNNSATTWFEVHCLPSTIARVRVELDLLLVLIIVETLLLIVLFISAIIFCLDFKRNCCCFAEEEHNSWYFDRAGTGVVDKRLVRYNPIPLKEFGNNE